MSYSSSEVQGFSNQPEYAFLREFKEREVSFETLNRFGAHAVGIGRKVTQGQKTDQLCLRFYVAKKRPIESLNMAERIPESFSFRPRQSEQEVRIITDVIEAPPARSEQPIDPESRIRPVPGGVSGGAGATGTIGGWVWDTTDDTIVMLSNDHVFGHTAGSDIIQPGSADGGSSPADKIGDVKRGIARSRTSTNIVDCAIGDPDSTDIYELTVVEIGPAVYATAVGTEGMRVEKYGQTTRHTFGEIEDVDWTGTIDYVLPFSDCMYVDIVPPSTDWSAGGDSGSLVFSQTPISPDSDIKPVVGLHFAGGGTYGIVCKIQNVFNALSLTTLCDGAFPAYLDSMFVEEGSFAAHQEQLASLAMGRAREFSPASFSRKEREMMGASRFYFGISREIQRRLMTSERGRMVTNFVDRHRAQLLTLLTQNGDVRRQTVASLKPLLAGTVTTSDVFAHVLTAQDIKGLEKLVQELSRHSKGEFQNSLRMIERLLDASEGKRIGQILEVDS